MKIPEYGEGPEALGKFVRCQFYSAKAFSTILFSACRAVAVGSGSKEQSSEIVQT